MIFSLTIIAPILLKGLNLGLEGFLKGYMLLEDLSSSQAKDLQVTILLVMILLEISLHIVKINVCSTFL